MTNADCLASLMGDGRRGVCVTARLPRPRVIIDACFLHASGLAEVITGVSASDVARRFSYPFGTQQPLPGFSIMSGSKLFNCMPMSGLLHITHKMQQGGKSTEHW